MLDLDDRIQAKDDWNWKLQPKIGMKHLQQKDWPKDEEKNEEKRQEEMMEAKLLEVEVNEREDGKEDPVSMPKDSTKYSDDDDVRVSMMM